MTHNQINYWNLQETKRHNVTTEGETNRHNVATEGETHRHNKATEYETTRHNLTTEGIDLGRLNESIRHNKESERQTDTSLGIELGKLAETQRHNRAQEMLTGTDLSIKSGQLAESSRHNLATEDLTELRTTAQNRLDDARASLTEIQAMWEHSKSSLANQLTLTQIAQIEQAINESSKRIDKLDSDIKRNRVQNVVDATRGLQNISSAVKNFSDTASDWLGLIPLLQ